MGKRVKNPTIWTRKRLYETAIAALALAIVYGLINGDQADAWLGLIAAALGIARANVSD